MDEQQRLIEIHQQVAALNKEAEQIKKAIEPRAMTEIINLMKTYGFNVRQVGAAYKASKAPRNPRRKKQSAE